MITKKGIATSRIMEHLESDKIKFKVVIELESDIDVENIDHLNIQNCLISIEKRKNIPKISVYKAYKVTGIIKANGSNTAEIFLEKLIYDIFSLNSAYISITRPFYVSFYYEDKWHPHPTNYATFQSINIIDKEIFIENINIINKFYDIKKRTELGDKLISKIKKTFELIKRGILLKSNYASESFLCFYRVIEIVADDIKSGKYKSINYPDNILEMKNLGLIHELKSQKMRIYLILKVFKINSIEIYDKKMIDRDFIKLADIRNKLSHTDETIDTYSLELVHKLSILILKKYIDILSKN